MASSKRERELARMRAQRQAARRAEAEAARVKRRNSVLIGASALAIVAVVAVIALVTNNGKSSSAAAKTSSSPSVTATPVPSGKCTYSPTGTPSKTVVGKPSKDGPASTSAVTATLATNRGTIKLDLNARKAPCTVNSFTFLAAQKYFDNTKCHRLTTSGIFVLQCGDPSATGSGGPGYQFADENLTALGSGSSVTYPRGTIAMANAGPGTNGSQFFLVYKDSPLPPNYTPFGSIVGGLPVLDTVAQAGSTPASDGHPNLAVTITKVTLG